MKTYCECGYPNDLGRLFCVRCGVKLDLTRVREEIGLDQQVESTKNGLYAVALAMVLVAAGLVALLLWPAKPFTGSDAEKGKRDLVDASLNRLQAMAVSGSEPYTHPAMKEQDINAWISSLPARSGFRSMTVKLSPKRCTLRIVGTRGPYSFLLFQKRVNVRAISYSRDVSCGMVSNRFAVTGAKIGHLPMVGPLVQKVADNTLGIFDDMPREKAIVSKITDAKIEDGLITVTVSGAR